MDPYHIYDLRFFLLFWSRCSSFHFLGNVLWCTKNYFLWNPVLSIFYSVACAVGVISEVPLPNPVLHRLTPMFSSNSFIAFTLTFRSLIHFYVHFFCAMREVPVHSFLFPGNSTIYWRGYSFPFEWSWRPCWKSTGHRCMDLFLDCSIPLTHESVLMVPLRSYDYCSFVLSFKVDNWVLQHCCLSWLFWLFGALKIPCGFWII